MICFLQQNWRLGWTKVEKILLVLRLHDGQTPPTWKLNSRIIPSPELTLLLFKMFLRWCILCFCLLNWKIPRLNKRKGAINFPFYIVFQTHKYQKYPHELFRKSFLRQGFSKFWAVCRGVLLHVRSIFFVPPWRQSLQCDDGSCC